MAAHGKGKSHHAHPARHRGCTEPGGCAWLRSEWHHPAGTGDRGQSQAHLQHTCSPGLLQPTALPRTALPSPLQWDFQKNHCAGRFVLGKIPLPASSQQSHSREAVPEGERSAQNRDPPTAGSLWELPKAGPCCSPAIPKLQLFLSATNGHRLWTTAAILENKVTRLKGWAWIFIS